MAIVGWIVLAAAIAIVAAGIRIVDQTQRGLILRFGKYNRFAEPGLKIIIPVVERLIEVNITEEMVDAERQEIITNDNLNAQVDAQVYFKVKADEQNVYNSQFEVNDYKWQIVNLARTTLRNIIGTMTLKEANSERNKINKELMEVLQKETENWGIDVVRTELKQIDPPADVQETMNKVVKAENEKIAAKDYATAEETRADGARRAAIKEAEGRKRAKILEAEGEAEFIKLVNNSANEHFVGNAQLLKQLETVENSLSDNTKVVLPTDSKLVNVIGELSGVLPLEEEAKE